MQFNDAITEYPGRNRHPYRVQARLALLRELQSAAGEELDALLPSVLDRAFKGEL